MRDDMGMPDDLMTVRVDPRGVVWLTWAPQLRITGVVAKEAIRVVEDLTDGVPCPMIVDITGSAVTTREARQVFAETTAVNRFALVGRSAVHRVIANFTVLVDPPRIPVRFFTDESAALDWLLHDDTRR